MPAFDTDNLVTGLKLSLIVRVRNGEYIQIIHYIFIRNIRSMICGLYSKGLRTIHIVHLFSRIFLLCFISKPGLFQDNLRIGVK
ncbi:hypothetical protein D3C75_681910 [compost metagenome]